MRYGKRQSKPIIGSDGASVKETNSKSRMLRHQHVPRDATTAKIFKTMALTEMEERRVTTLEALGNGGNALGKSNTSRFPSPRADQVHESFRGPGVNEVCSLVLAILPTVGAENTSAVCGDFIFPS